MFIVDLFIVLVAALLGRILSKKLGQPVILGEIVAGMTIGALDSFGVHLIAQSQALSDFGDVGALLLLFSAGLVTNLEEMRSLGRPSLVAAAGGVVIPFGLGYLVAIQFGYSTFVALIAGTGLVATSVGVSAEALTELRMLRMRIGTLVMATAVADDVLGILILSVVTSLVTSGQIPFAETVVMLVLVMGFFALSLALGVRAVTRVWRHFELGRYDLLLVGVIFAVAMGAIADAVGLALIVGGFVAGLMLGKSRQSTRLVEHITLVGEGFFVPIFFVTTGMSFRLGAMMGVSGFAVVLVVMAILGKVLGCSLGAYASGFGGRSSAVLGVAMIPRAEVVLVVIKLGLDAGVLPADVASSLLLVVLVTTLVGPPLLSYTVRRMGVVPGRPRPEQSGTTARRPSRSPP